VLDQAACQRRAKEQEHRRQQDPAERAKEPVQCRRQVRGVERECVRPLDEWPQGLGEAHRDARRERADEQCSRSQQQRVIDLA
jgi:hypothetical protein